jgi:hypothetical protein
VKVLQSVAGLQILLGSEYSRADDVLVAAVRLDWRSELGDGGALCKVILLVGGSAGTVVLLESPFPGLLLEASTEERLVAPS